MKNEIWKAIPKYEGFYEASSEGRIRRVIDKHEDEFYIIDTKRDVVVLSKNGVKRQTSVAQIIAETFIENSKGSKKAVLINSNAPAAVKNVEWSDYTDSADAEFNAKQRKYKREKSPPMSQNYTKQRDILTGMCKHVKPCTVEHSLKTIRNTINKTKNR